MPTRRDSVIGLVEAAYRPTLAPEVWCAELAAATGAFDQGLGAFVALERFHPEGRQKLAFRAVGNPDLATFLERVGAHSDPVADVFARRIATVGSLRHIVTSGGDALARAALDRFFAALAPLDIADLWGIGAADPGGGWILVLCWPTRDRAEPRGFRNWARTALHLAAGVRLRAAFMAHGPVDPVAILSPDGKVLDAAPGVARDVRERLARGVRASEEARGALRGDDERALTLWQALTAGRFSLVDRVDTDGRRFVLALPNTLGGETPFGLSPRERDVVRWAVDGASNKEAAYALGLTVGGYSAQLARAMRKLKVLNRTELKLLFIRADALSEPGAVATARRVGYVPLPLEATIDRAVRDALTPGQRALVALLADGLSNQAIAERLGVSPHTVRNRVAALSARLGGPRRSELVRRLADRG